MPLPHKKRDKPTARRDFFERRDAAAVDKAIAAKKAKMRKHRAAVLAKKPKSKPLPWYQKYNPFRILAEGPLKPEE